MRKLSLCLTNYNRTHMLKESFEQVIDDDRISEIIISDDHSNDETIRWIKNSLYHQKLRIFWHNENVGMSLNKKKSIEYASNEWCIVFDSDNVLTNEYIDALFRENLHDKTIYCPSFARPQFNYTRYELMSFGKKTVKPYLKNKSPMFEPLMNTCNYVVNRAEYLSVYDYNPEMKGTDTIWFNYLWLKAGNWFFVVPGMEYDHRVHEGSGFMADLNYNMEKAKEVKRLILSL